MSPVEPLAAFDLIDLAVGVIIGAAFGKIIASLVENVFMPLLGLVLPGGGYQQWTFEVAGTTVPYGKFLGDVVYFLVVALALFLFVVKFLGWVMRTKAAAPPAPTKDQELLTEIRDLLKKNAPAVEATPARARTASPCVRTRDLPSGLRRLVRPGSEKRLPGQGPAVRGDKRPRVALAGGARHGVAPMARAGGWDSWDSWDSHPGARPRLSLPGGDRRGVAPMARTPRGGTHRTSQDSHPGAPATPRHAGTRAPSRPHQSPADRGEQHVHVAPKCCPCLAVGRRHRRQPFRVTD
jgi:large conductance mechanosensitive channel